MTFSFFDFCLHFFHGGEEVYIAPNYQDKYVMSKCTQQHGVFCNFFTQNSLLIFLFVKFVKHLGIDLKRGLGITGFENC